MMGHLPRTESLFYYFRLEEQIPEDHLLRLIDRHIDLSFVRERLKGMYSSTGRPSIDPEVLLRLLLVGYLYGITSERRLLEEVRMHLAYRWFTRLDFEQEIPDHSTFSKNRHGRFRQAGVFREVFEEIVRRCLAAGLVEGKNLAVDGTMVGANASRQSRVRREQLQEAAQVSQTVQEYLAALEQANPVVDREMISTTDTDAVWATKGGPAMMAYFDNYLIDTSSRVILGVEATPALFHPGDGSRTQDDGASRKARGSTGECGSGQGVWQWRVSGVAVSPRRATAYSRDRSSPSNGWVFYAGAVSLRSCGECLLLPGRESPTLSRSATEESGLCLRVNASTVPRLCPKKALHSGSRSPALRTLARTGPADGTHAGRNASL